MQSKNWVYTLNNPEVPTDWTEVPDVKYAIYQLEKGEQGTPHYQGYVEFTKNKRLSAVRKILPKAHWDIRRGTQQQAYDYVTKSLTKVEGPWEYGEYKPNQPGKRNDLLAVKEDIDKGTPYNQLWEDHFVTMLRHDRGITKYMNIVKCTPRSWMTECTVLVGPTEYGKTKWAYEKDPTLYKKTSHTGKWFDGYNQQPTVLLDDFYGWIKYSDMLPMIDRYPHQVEQKGGILNFAPKHIIITSNTSPKDWYPNINRSKAALYRRFTKIIWANSKDPSTWIEYSDIESFAAEYIDEPENPRDQELPATPPYRPPPDSPVM